MSSGLVVSVFVLVVILPILLFANRRIQHLESYSEAALRAVSSTSEGIAQDLARRFLSQKGQDIATKISLYLSTHPADRFRSPNLIRLSIEKIGESGYSSVYDCKTFLTLAHPDPKIVGMDGREIGNKFPEWFKIWNSGCREAEGTYAWRLDDGTPFKKYMVVTPVPNSNYMVAATLTLAEFQKDTETIQIATERSFRGYQSRLAWLTKGLIQVVCIAAVAFVTLFLFLQWTAIQRHLLKPINSLLESGRKKDNSETWPIEIQSVEEKLRKLLEERDHATNEAHRLKTQSMLHDLSQRILHDLKSPLGTLGMMIETEFKEVPCETKDSMRRVLGRIRASVDSNLKDYSQRHTVFQAEGSIEAGPVLEPPSSMVGGALKAILEEEKVRAAAQGVEFIETLSKKTYQSFSPVSFSDLCRVFSNLLSNAVEAAAQGKKKVLIDASVNGEFIEVRFRDYGTGFEPDALKKLLSGTPTTTKTQGNGLGFLNAKSLIEAAGGSLDVKSFPNGTLITLLIPTIAAPIWFEDITRASARSILALDDDSTIAQRLVDNLPGLRVELVQSESEFLSRIVEAQHDLYLIDYDFGGLRNGLDLVTQERLQQKVVLISGRIVFDQRLRLSAIAQRVRMFPKQSLS